jgi:hypothetical protein
VPRQKQTHSTVIVFPCNSGAKGTGEVCSPDAEWGILPGFPDSSGREYGLR